MFLILLLRRGGLLSKLCLFSYRYPSSALSIALLPVYFRVGVFVHRIEGETERVRDSVFFELESICSA